MGEPGNCLVFPSPWSGVNTQFKLSCDSQLSVRPGVQVLAFLQELRLKVKQQRCISKVVAHSHVDCTSAGHLSRGDASRKFWRTRVIGFLAACLKRRAYRLCA
jgi:hypothetical protein